MANVPFHQEVIKFSQLIMDEANRLIGREKYKFACEHEHSCCLLIADSDKFLINGEWHTWIDYEKFHALATSGRTGMPTELFLALALTILSYLLILLRFQFLRLCRKDTFLGLVWQRHSRI